MKVDLGAINALYPMPVVIVGTEIDGKANFITIAHVGIVDLNTLSLSIVKTHFSNRGILENRALSINLPTDARVIETDYVGMVSGATVDKSDLFEIFFGELKGAPMMTEAPVSMACKVVQIIDRGKNYLYLVEPNQTYCKREILSDGKIDFAKVRPILFDMPRRKYWGLGNSLGDCWTIGKRFENKLKG